MTTVVCIQARLGSTRLPRKALEPIAGLPAIAHVVIRAEAAGYQTWVLCPASDHREIQKAVPGANVFPWAGPTSDVLGRFAAFARGQPSVSTIVRLSGDCPFVDLDSIYALGTLVHQGTADFATTNPGQDEPWIDGYDVEAFSVDLLRNADAKATKPGDREHVTPWMRRRAARPWTAHRQSDGVRHRWTLDTPEDLTWFRRVAAEIDCTPPDHPTYGEMMRLLKTRPELRRTNA